MREDSRPYFYTGYRKVVQLESTSIFSKPSPMEKSHLLVGSSP